MAIRAQGLDAEFTQVRSIWSAVGIDKREKQLCARVGGFFAELPFVRAKHARRAVGRVIGADARIGIFGEVKWAELAVFGAVCAIARDGFDFEHFEIGRAIAIGHDVKFVKGIGKRNAIQDLRKQIYGRGAKQLEAGAINSAFERGFLLLERDGQIELIALVSLRGISQSGQLEKQVTLRQRKVFAKEPIALKTAWAWRSSASSGENPTR